MKYIDYKFHVCTPTIMIKISRNSKIDEMNMSVPIEYIRIRRHHKTNPCSKIKSSSPPF